MVLYKPHFCTIRGSFRLTVPHQAQHSCSCSQSLTAEICYSPKNEHSRFRITVWCTFSRSRSNHQSTWTFFKDSRQVLDFARSWDGFKKCPYFNQIMMSWWDFQHWCYNKWIKRLKLNQFLFQWRSGDFDFKRKSDFLEACEPEKPGFPSYCLSKQFPNELSVPVTTFSCPVIIISKIMITLWVKLVTENDGYLLTQQVQSRQRKSRWKEPISTVTDKCGHLRVQFRSKVHRFMKRATAALAQVPNIVLVSPHHSSVYGL